MPPTVYRAPPKGYRSRRIVFWRGYTRRFKDEGPYETFITYKRERVYAATHGSIRATQQKWQEAQQHIEAILWGNRAQRIEAKENLQLINLDNFPTGEGRIEVENWSQAGDQLEKAVRDYHIYGSTARFEDVRDFIWERISNLNYPMSWRVKPELFYAQVESTAEYYSTLRQKSLIDTQDGVFYEWLLQHSSYGLPSYRENTDAGASQQPGLTPALSIPGYTFPPLGFRSEYECRNFIDTSVEPGLTRRNPEDGPYGIFIHHSENDSPFTRPIPPDLLPQLRPLWNQAQPHLDILLWCDDEGERKRAYDLLLNLNLDSIQKIEPADLEISNWNNAGHQLRLAIRDFHLYGSICRFEDVRDFIWERISLRNYPPEWRVKREDFAREIIRTTESYRYLRDKERDPRDGISREERIRSMRDWLPQYLEEEPETSGESSQDSDPPESPTPLSRRQHNDHRERRGYREDERVPGAALRGTLRGIAARRENRVQRQQASNRGSGDRIRRLSRSTQRLSRRRQGREGQEEELYESPRMREELNRR